MPNVTSAAVKAFTMRQFGTWAVPDDDVYYSGQFLSYTNQPARRLRRFSTHGDGNEQWADHFALLQEQLQDFQVRVSLGLGTT